MWLVKMVRGATHCGVGRNWSDPNADPDTLLKELRESFTPDPDQLLPVFVFEWWDYVKPLTKSGMTHKGRKPTVQWYPERVLVREVEYKP